jgi:serine protease Do
MSLFKDDFYSTKMTKRKRANGYGSDRNPDTRFIIALASLGAGVVMTLIFTMLFTANAFEEESALADLKDPETILEMQLHLNDLVVDAAEHVNPTVVGIISNQTGDEGTVFELGMGSGIIFGTSEDKIRIVTNNHVIQYGNHFEIVMLSGERREATVIGTDELSDLAVLEAAAEGNEKIAEFGDSAGLKSGQTAIAIGNPLGLGFSHTTTVGVISSPHRTIPVSLGLGGFYDWELDVIQTDAAINNGNSGGALVNLEGKVIGINSLKVSDMGVEGLGFAIPINTAKPILDSLIEHGKVKRPFMGVGTEDLQFMENPESLDLPDDVVTGIVVVSVSGPAAEANLRRDDVIVRLDDESVGSTLLLRKYLYANKEIGDTIEVHYYRNGSKESTVLTLGEMNN